MKTNIFASKTLGTRYTQTTLNESIVSTVEPSMTSNSKEVETPSTETAIVIFGTSNESQLLSLVSQPLKENTGTEKGDQLAGTAKADRINGLKGRDVINGGEGDDIINGGVDGDTITTGLGRDRIVYDSFSDRGDTSTDFNLTEDALVLTGLFKEIGYQGVDPISDGYLQFVQQGLNTLVQIDPDGADGASPFRTLVTLENVNADYLNSYALNEITGTSKADKLTGTNGQDTISGLAGKDTLIGGNGDDIIIGGFDGDRLTGGLGQDLFVYNGMQDAGDTITDFNVEQDKLVLSNLFEAIDYQGVDPIDDGYLQFVQQGSSTVVQVDADGIDGPSQFKTLSTLQQVNVADLAIGSNVIV
jgi:Ca2+-binding RTX toxin-like protein